MPETLIEFVLPELGLPADSIKTSVRLVRAGRIVYAGERLLELAAGDVTVDLPAPVAGRLVRWLVEEDEPVHVGQALAIIAPSDG